MRPYWDAATNARITTQVWARRAAPGVDVASSVEEIAEAVSHADVVLALWGVTEGSEEALAENANLARRAQDAARALGATSVIHAMTAAVYTPSELALSEASPTQPRHPYGRSKLAAERVLAGANPPATILRFGNVMGTDGLARAVASGRPVVLDQFPNGRSPARSYIAPDDLARVLVALILLPAAERPRILNIAGPYPVEMDALLRAAGVDFTYRPAPVGALAVQNIDVQRLRSLGIETERSSLVPHLAQFLPKTGQVP